MITRVTVIAMIVMALVLGFTLQRLHVDKLTSGLVLLPIVIVAVVIVVLDRRRNGKMKAPR